MVLTALELDVLLELINIGVGRAAGMLNQLVNAHVQLRVPELRALSPREALTSCETILRESPTTVHLSFSGRFSGLSALLMPRESADRLVGLVLGEQNRQDLEEDLRRETLREIGNITLNGVMGSIANIMQEKLVYAGPEYLDERFEDLLRACDPSDTVLVAATHFSIKDHRIGGDVLILFNLRSLGTLLESIDAMTSA